MELMSKHWRRSLAILTLTFTAACGGGTKPAPVQPAATPAPPAIPVERKVAWILRLEQQRVIADAAVGADLIKLVADTDAGVRRRAALAIGRTGVPEGLEPLQKALADPEEAVRSMAAFALGLLGDTKAAAALEAALADTAPTVRGRAAEALGQLAVTASAGAIATSAAPCGALIVPIDADEEKYPLSPEVEACRLSILALVRLRQYDALAKVVLTPDGRPVSSWWPVAFALQRVGDARAADALNTLASGGTGVYTQAFALRGLAGYKDARAVAPAIAIAGRNDADVRLRASAIRALGQLGDERAVQPLIDLVRTRTAPPNLRLEAMTALGTLGNRRALTTMLDLFSAPSPYVRAAAMSAAAKIDPDGFLLALSSLERDADWWVRASLATTLADLPPENAQAALLALADDADTRVQGPALEALARGSEDLSKRLADALAAPDFALRAAAAGIIAGQGDRRAADSAAQLAAAYTRGESDATPSARLAALDALARFPNPGPAEVNATLTKALADAEWPVRVRAAALLRQRGVTAAAPQRPAPIRHPAEYFESDRVLRPQYSPQAYIEIPAGTIQIELDVIEAPLTTLTFIELARAGFFNGSKVHRLIPNFVVQTGDPRGDGEGGPGYTIRDEFGTKPFVRGSVGMALGGPETGGSQFFITVSPQPHLDGRYTLFGRVVRGQELLDAISIGDLITRVTILDGTAVESQKLEVRSQK